MTFLLEKDFRIGFFTGCLLHLIYLWPRVQWLSLSCKSFCADITLADAPLSLLYFAFPEGGLIFFSLLFGSFQWGIWSYLILRIVQFVVSRIVHR